jgi:hypothetical protein
MLFDLEYFLESDHFNLLSHAHIVKNGVFIEKPPVTSSNCYETLKKMLQY